MRTTLDIDDDLLIAAKQPARKDKVSAGRALSRLARVALCQGPVGPHPARRAAA